MTYAIVKNWEIQCFSDKIPVKSKPGIYEEKVIPAETVEEENEKGELVEKIIKEEEIEKICVEEPVDGMIYDEAIEIDWEYDYTKEYQFIDGKIQITEKPEFIPKVRTKEEIQEELWKLVNQKNGMIELEEDTVQIDIQIEALKDEYKSIQ